MANEAAEIESSGSGFSVRIQFGSGFLFRCFEGPMKQAAGILEDHLRVTRWERRKRLVRRVEAFAKKQNIAAPTRQISAKIFVPLVEAAVTEDDDELQDLWARMLINAANANADVEIRRAYISILQDCTCLDIRILAALYNVAPELRGKPLWSKPLPHEAKLLPAGNAAEGDHRAAPETLRSLWNLHRLGLIASGAFAADGDNQMLYVSITALGAGLVEACTLKEE
jgi:Abortive infection alpha